MWTLTEYFCSSFVSFCLLRDKYIRYIRIETAMKNKKEQNKFCNYLILNSLCCFCLLLVAVGLGSYFPIQNFPKIVANISLSISISPVISPRCRSAVFMSCEIKSDEICCCNLPITSLIACCDFCNDS